jgi:hypothetical protein
MLNRRFCSIAVFSRKPDSLMLAAVAGALARRMVRRTSKEIPLLSSAAAILKSFQTSQIQRRK